MADSHDFLGPWYRRDDSKAAIQMSALESRDEILTSVNFLPASRLVMGFVLRLVITCKTSAANKILEKLFQIRELPQATLPQVDLELFWNRFGGRPDNTPWKLWDQEHLNEAGRTADPENVKFYEMWTEPNWVQATVKTSNSPNHDSQQWDAFRNAWTGAISARSTCKPEDGRLPSRETLETAFQAIDKLFTSIPPRGIEHGTVAFWYGLEVRVYFILAVYLGHMEAAQNVMREASKTSWLLKNLFDVPVFYEVLSTSVDDPIIHFDDALQMDEAEEMICAALTTRIEESRKSPLDGVSWTELLKRFSEAAFFVYNQEYLSNEIKSAEGVLRPPLTQDEIDEIENKDGFGALPADIKEMALIADGFFGGWHFAGGGWGGIKSLWKSRASEFEIYLDYFPPPKMRMETRTNPDGSTYQVKIFRHEITVEGSGNDWGDLYWGTGSTENDNFEHIICPHATWKNVQTAKGEEVEEGEYAYLYFANWTAGPDKIYPSFKSYLSELTMNLERSVAVGYSRRR